MKLTHEICIDHDSTVPGATDERMQQVLTAIGHDPVNCSFVAERDDATVHGRVSVAWCDTRILGLDKIGFRDGRVEVATAENIGAWFKEQGHRLMKIEGSKAFGNTIVNLQITEEDEAPTRDRKTTLRRPVQSSALEVIAQRLVAIK